MSVAGAMAAAADGRCFLCGAHADYVTWRENGYRAVACGCGLTFVQPAPPDDAIDPTFDAHSAAFYRLPAARKVQWLQRHRGFGTLFEIGCGDGWFLDAARRAGFDAHGVDANAERVANARARGFDVRHALFEKMDTDDRFDVVFHCDLLSHFPEPLAALRRMKAMLREDGLLFFEVGILGGAARVWYPRIGGIGLPQHRWLYTDEALARLFADAGIRVVAQKRFGLGASVWLSQSIRRVAPIAKHLIQRPAAPATNEAIDAVRVATSSRPRWRSYLNDVQERVEDFARYELGALTPTLGPATLLVLAQPQERST